MVEEVEEVVMVEEVEEMVMVEEIMAAVVAVTMVMVTRYLFYRTLHDAFERAPLDHVDL